MYMRSCVLYVHTLMCTKYNSQVLIIHMCACDQANTTRDQQIGVNMHSNQQIVVNMHSNQSTGTCTRVDTKHTRTHTHVHLRHTRAYTQKSICKCS